MVIGIVLPYLKARGTEKQALRLTKGFIKKNHSVIIFVIQGWGDSFMYELFKKSGAKVINIGRPINIGEKKVSLQRFFPLLKHILLNRCDLIINRASISNRISGYVGLALFIPVVCVLSSRIEKKTENNKYFRAIKSFNKLLSFGFPSKILTVSKEGRDNLSASYPVLASKIIAIQNGVEVPNFYKKVYTLPTNRKFKFCFSGSLDINRKGIDLLLEALRMIIYENKFENVSLVFIGQGKDKHLIEKIALESNIYNYIEFTGEVTSPIKEMKNYDSYVLPSRREGFPNSLLEAMSIGMPCISSNCLTGPKEIIDHNKNGILFENNNSIDLCKSMIKLIQNPKLREELGKNAREKIRKYLHVDLMINGYVNKLDIKDDK